MENAILVHVVYGTIIMIILTCFTIQDIRRFKKAEKKRLEREEKERKVGIKGIITLGDSDYIITFTRVG